MDCRSFRRQHLAFVDDTLPGVDLVVMEQHRAECQCCAAHDALVRRSLLLARNIPIIEPSARFSARLERRLRETRLECGHAHVAPALARGPGFGSFLAAAGVVMAVGAGAFGLVNRSVPRDLVHAPVIANAPEPVSASMANSAVVASVSAGMPMWPALFLADEFPARVAQVGFEQGFRTAGFTR